MALCGLVLVFVQYLPVGVIIDFQKHQADMLYRMDKLENCPDEEEKEEEEVRRRGRGLLYSLSPMIP